MSEQTFDELYGGKGIDTPYEHDKITYRPQVKYTKKGIYELIRPEIKQSIERARTFTVSQILSDYDELIAEIDELLVDLAARNSVELLEKLKTMLSQKQFKDIIAFERGQSGYNQTGDFELYSLLYNMKQSLQVRRDFIDEKFRTQFTSETDIEKIEEAELASIEQWEQLEARVMDTYSAMTELDNHDDEDFPLQDESLSVNMDELNYESLESLESQKRNSELLHTSLADTSYVHRNRYFMFLNVIEKAKILIYNAGSLIDDNLKDFIMSLNDMSDFTAAKSHLILQFKSIRDKHEGLKGRMMTIDDEKENFGSEKQYLYQQLEVKTIEPLKSWMYQQEDSYSGALDKFSQYMVNSMKESRTVYEGTLADMLNFYKSESDFYEQQINFLKDKEEIRRFYSILEDLEGADRITNTWVDEYLKVNGYSSQAYV
ncbi:hypothetical protein ACWA2C_16010 [Priestia megaterium]